jgi:phosphohistidine phosphatase SixA
VRIVLVRHGQAQAKIGWDGPDADRALVARGRRQAHHLGKVIGAARTPIRVISSPALRCVQTVEPYADRLSLAVELSDQLSTSAGPSALALCRQLWSSGTDDSTVVLCTHREVLVEVLPELSKQFGRKLTHRLPGAKGGAWILRFRARKLTKIDYRPPAV